MANSDNFHIGDRVRLIEKDEFIPRGIKKGDEGVVVRICGTSIGIDWGRDIGGNSCLGKCRGMQGWFMPEYYIELVTEVAAPDVSEEEFCALLCGEVRYGRT